MTQSTNELDRILIESDSAGICLRRFYLYTKSIQRKYSLNYLCNRIGIPSKGYLSLIMKGQRRLHGKYWDSACKTFKLNNQQEKIFKLLLELDYIDCLPTRYLQQDKIQYLKEEFKIKMII